MKKIKPKDQNQKNQGLSSLKKTIGIATVVASLGASLGVNVGELMAQEKAIFTETPMTTSDVMSDQHKVSNQIKWADQHKESNQIKWADQHKESNQIKWADQHKESNQIKWADQHKVSK